MQQPIKHISLFSGIGGPDLAAEWMGWENISHTEWNAFGQNVLKYYWPNADSHHDITKTDYTIYRGRADVLTGGFPCQGFSLAGKRMGTDDDRYLWPEMRRAYNECRPTFIIGENVTGLLSMEDKSGVYRDVFPQVEGGKVIRTLECDYYEKIYSRQAKMLIGTICENLEEDGYEIVPFVIPASAVGAPHKRERIWIVAYRTDSGPEDVREPEVGADRSANAAHTTSKQNIGRRQGRFQSEFTGIDDERPAPHPDSDGHGCDNRAEQTGCPEGKGESIIEKRQRLRGNTGRIGAKENAAYTPDIGHEQSWHSWHRRTGSSDSNCDGNDSHPDGFGLRGQSDGIGGAGFAGEIGTPDDWSNFPTQSPVCNGNDGISAGLDFETVFEGFAKPLSWSKWRSESIKAGGNAIVPQVILQFFEAIDEILNQKPIP